MKNINTIAIIFTFVVTIILFSVAINKIFGKGSPNYEAIKFAQEKPELVRALKARYQTEIDKVEQNLLKTEKSPQDILIEEVVNQLDPKK